MLRRFAFGALFIRAQYTQLFAAQEIAAQEDRHKK
jgi:hypothetical protein